MKPRTFGMLAIATLLALLAVLGWRTIDCRLRAVCDVPTFFGFPSPGNARV